MDSLLARLPIINGKLIYQDSINIPGQNVSKLDSMVKRWFYNNFQYRCFLPQKGKDTLHNLLGQGIMEFSDFNRHQIVKYHYYLVMTIQINCRDNSYSYKISDMGLVLKNKFLNSAVMRPATPEYIIDLYKHKKHYWWTTGFTSNGLKDYLANMNRLALNTVASLKKAMANQ